MIDTPNARWGVALLFAVEPSDRALAGWGPGPDPVDGHPRWWARKELEWLVAISDER